VLASWILAYGWLALWVIVAKHYWPRVFA
jgi:hypothetical protein